MNAHTTGVRAIRNVVITRSREGNAELAAKLRALGFEPISIDSIEFLPPEDWSSVDACLRGLEEFDWLLFTSSTGVEFFVKRMRDLSLRAPLPERPAVAAVGERTGAALERKGIQVEFVPSAYLTRALAEELPRDRGRKVLILRADIGDPELVATLRRDGFQVRDETIYRTSVVAAGATEEALESSLDGAGAVLFASPSAVEALMARLPSAATDGLAKRLLAVCIGPVTAKAARRRGFERVLTAEKQTVEGLVECLTSASSEGKEGRS